MNRPLHGSHLTATVCNLLTEAENYNDEAINSALQRLSIRQQQRQYSAHKGAGLLHKEGDRRPATTGTFTSGVGL